LPLGEYNPELRGTGLHGGNGKLLASHRGQPPELLTHYFARDTATDTFSNGLVTVGLGGIVALYDRSSSLYHILTNIFGTSFSEATIFVTETGWCGYMEATNHWII
jgi:hypothetical protein